ncbi:interferon-induced protein with tetratricopeptide repeats 5-like [Oncorhynchus kisutch]|uniref:interferon-induced protein with tetratricopeptide repeats 5-like n=1 Tax=Oncorhynchus kisutch TaxID=8019 RepID=UPI0012DF31D9|nr:interferon-induced protein with tetratricopeptide repeats 5-like [Oncorhynchus kisutch]
MGIFLFSHSASVTTDMEVKLKALECHFTWGIEKDDIKDRDSLPEKLLDRVMKFSSPNHATYFNLLAFLSHLEENNVSALEYLHKAESALKNRQDDTELLVTYANFAWVHYHSGNMNDVDAYIGKLENINKGVTTAIQGSLPTIHGEKAWSFLRLGGLFYLGAKESFQKALKEEPDNASFNVGYAMVLYRLEGLARKGNVRLAHTEGATQLRKSLEPDNTEIMVLLALQLQKQSRHESMKLITEALRLSPDVPLVIRYVAEFFSHEGINETLEVLKKAVKLSPHSSFMHNQIGRCHKSQFNQMSEQKRKGIWRVNARQIKEKMELCIHHFSRAVELKPSNVQFRLNLAEAYGDNYQLEEAMKIFTNLLKDESLSDSDKQQCYSGFSLFLFFRKKDEDGAVTQFKKAYQIPIESWDRNKARKRLKQIANQKRVGEASEILEFLATEDKKGRNAEAPRRVEVHSSDTDDLTDALGKGMKLK